MNYGARFQSKRIIVTGAGSGIGRATLIRLVAEGGVCVGVDLNESGLAETVALAAAQAAHGGRAAYVVASVADEAMAKAVVNDFVTREGGLDVLINMAGILRSSHTAETALEDFMQLININLAGTFLMCREAIPHLLKTRGNVVNAGSTSATFGHPYMSAYAASKGGVESMTHAMAWEYLKQGVRFNAVAPGGIVTPLMEGTAAGFPAQADTSLFAHMARPDGRFGKPEDVAGVIAMLASADGNNMSGSVIRVDGGVHA